MRFIRPQVSVRTALASIAGCNLVMMCPNCGEKIKPVDELMKVVHLSKELGDILPRLNCNSCRAKPTRMMVRNVWVAKFGLVPDTEDLTFLLAGEMKAAA